MSGPVEVATSAVMNYALAVPYDGVPPLAQLEEGRLRRQARRDRLPLVVAACALAGVLVVLTHRPRRRKPRS